MIRTAARDRIFKGLLLAAAAAITLTLLRVDSRTGKTVS